ncbi:alkaline phosphatase family protein [Desulfosporosinus sp. OT]|uniref:alkaline phosphatase family protein n=1 Tax=Desulfosporosinus sp. OT TaxID=913865 RepID=UPI0002239D64|nr:alkaline phosphatase family protein [Desulfosporosinus sp. OT]EGW37312.1 metalloenzyme superfamily protein [Desulfosporosinus sp. OT]
MHMVMIFLDGFGLGGKDDNPIVAAETPSIDELLGGHLLWGKRYITYKNTVLRPLDPLLGVEGTPQSATGQTTLWTGLNAAKAIGHHLRAYPNKSLAEIIAEKSIFRQLAELGKTTMFANTFTKGYDQAVAAGKRAHTASTLSALAGGVRLRRVPDLLAGLAVYQDMTNEILVQQGEPVSLISSFEAGRRLGNLALHYDFTLYEFFQTDVKGHKQLWDEVIGLVERIDSFIGGFLSVVKEEDVAWILTSDHGNIEDFSVKGHTMNPVPALCWSNQPMKWPEWNTLEEVTPGIIKLLTEGS